MLRSAAFVVAVAVAAALTLGACCTHHYAVRQFTRDPDFPPTLGERIEKMAESCAKGQRERIGFCEKNGREFAWFERSGVVFRNSRAYDVATGKLAYAEDRSWSDVAICVPDAVSRYGTPPPCTPVYMQACDSIDDLRERYGQPPASDPPAPSPATSTAR